MKLISLNIENDQHYSRVLPFLEREDADIVCLQEAPESVAPRIEELGYTTFFAPMVIRNISGDMGLQGILIAVRQNVHVQDTRTYYLYDKDGVITHWDPELPNLGVNNALMLLDIEHEGTPFTIGTCHFTWTPDGRSPSETQRNAMARYTDIVKNEKPHIICGDYNIPRHINPLYEELIRLYTDNTPRSYTSSLDKELHRLGNTLECAHLFTSFMVDYLFTMTPYRAQDVRLEFGLSDHAGIIGTVLKDA